MRKIILICICIIFVNLLNAQVKLIKDTAICQGISLKLNPYSQPQGGYSYFWSPANGLDDSLKFNPTATPDITTKYSIYAYKQGIVYKIADVTITVKYKPSTDFSYQLNNNSLTVKNKTANYDWIEWDFGDGATSKKINESHTYYKYADTTHYMLSLKAHNECGDSITQEDLMINPGLVEQLSDFDEIRIYPNPSTTGTINIDFGKIHARKMSCKIYDLMGQEIVDFERRDQLIIFKTLKAGPYLLVFFDANDNKVVKKLNLIM